MDVWVPYPLVATNSLLCCSSDGRLSTYAVSWDMKCYLQLVHLISVLTMVLGQGAWFLFSGLGGGVAETRACGCIVPQLTQGP